MMKHKYILLLFFLSIAFTSRSQSVNPDVIASAGDFYANSSGQIQWTLGEVAVETYQSTTNILTQGFHQPFVSAPTGITTISNNVISIYPNPANEYVSINFNTSTEKYIVSLTDLTGNILHSEEVSAADFSIYKLSLKNYSDGIYFITIRNP
ncbi:MAG: T9SS type A sorting domain-containing protein, partial [Bacteroidia bacterium]